MKRQRVKFPWNDIENTYHVHHMYNHMYMYITCTYIVYYEDPMQLHINHTFYIACSVRVSFAFTHGYESLFV